MNLLNHVFSSVDNFRTLAGSSASADSSSSDSENSQQCQAAIYSAYTNTQFKPCSDAVGTLTNTTSQSDYNQFCNGGCGSTISSIYSGLYSSCSDNAELASTFSKASKAFQFFCLQVNGEFCLPKLMKDSKTLTNATTSEDQYGMPTGVTNSQLQIVCSDCMVKIINAGISLGFSSSTGSSKDTASVLGGLCAKDNDGNYCYTSAYSTFTNLQRGKETDNDWQNMCSPCFRKVISSISDDKVRNSTQRELAGLTPLCRKDANGKTCVSRVPTFINFTEAADSAQSPCGRNATQPTCGVSACKTQRQSIIDTMGCCFPLMFDFFNANQKPRDRVTDDEINSAMCGITRDDRCAAAAQITVNLKFPNVKYSWYLANKATFDAALKRDIMRNTGLTEDQITIVVTEISFHKFRMMAASSGTTVTATLQPDSDSDASTIQSGVSSGSYTSKSIQQYRINVKQDGKRNSNNTEK